jgi:Na+/H+ antiporter NhaA
MSIFIATLAFPEAETLAAAKLSILVSSVVAGGIGAVMFQIVKK